MEHTPGPWKSENGTDAYLIGTDTTAIGRVYYTADDTGEANSRLIKAAPDLLAACEAARDALNSLPVDALGFENDGKEVWPLRDELIHALTDAIAKARGEGE